LGYKLKLISNINVEIINIFDELRKLLLETLYFNVEIKSLVLFSIEKIIRDTILIFISWNYLRMNQAQRTFKFDELHFFLQKLDELPKIIVVGQNTSTFRKSC
jgi:hypothetical protein